MIHDAELVGLWTIERYDRETGVLLGTHELKNTVQATGKEYLLKEISDWWSAGSANLLKTDQIALEIKSGADGGGGLIDTLTGAQEGFDNNSLSWRFEDNTNANYTPASLVIKNTGTRACTFSIANVSFGSKGPNENWHYIYTLKFTSTTGSFHSDGDGGSANYHPGFGKMLAYCSGEGFGTGYLAWDENVQLLAYPNGSGTPLTGTPTVTVAYGTETSYKFLEWTITCGIGVLTGQWYTLEIMRDMGGAPITLRSAADNKGTKGANDEWTLKYKLRIPA